MFKNVKKEYLILLIIIVILTTYLLRKNDNKVEIDIPELKQIEKDLIKQIVIENSKGNFSLKNEQKKWKLDPEGFPVLDKKVDTMVDLLSKTDISDLISRAEKYNKFGLGEKNRTVIKAFGDSGELRTLTTGNMAKSGNRTFVKLKDDKLVYQARGNYKENFDIKKNDIIDKKIFSFNSSDIVELIVEKKGIKEHFIKTNETEPVKSDEKKNEVKIEENKSPKSEAKMVWVNKADKKKVNDKEIDSYLSKNARINCESFLRKKDEQKDKGFLSIVFIDKTKKSYTLDLFNKPVSNGDKTDIEVSSNNSNFIFVLSKEDIESVSVDVEKLIKTEQKKKK